MPNRDHPASGLNQLDYAPKPSRRGLWIRRLGLLTGFICLAISTPRIYQHVAHYARAAYWEYQCMNFDPPKDVAIRGGDFSLHPAPPIYKQISNRDISTDIVPKCYEQFIQEADPNAIGTIGLPLFCHERTSPSGEQRLVMLEIWAHRMLKKPLAFMSARIFAPSLFGVRKITETDTEPWSDIKPASWPGSNVSDADTLVADTLARADRIYPGQPDPNDRSHFTIDYAIKDGQRGTIDGWLDDGNIIRLIARPGPIDVPAFWRSVEADM
jgi:hypothetical protein